MYGYGGENESLKDTEREQSRMERAEADYEHHGYDAECEARDMAQNPELYKEDNMEQALQKVEPTQVARIEPATRMSLQEAKNRFTAIREFCKSILTEGIDYGHIPNVKKPSLFKPGAEKILTFLMLRSVPVPIKVIEDFDRPLFFYRYQTDLYHIETGTLVGSGIGSCSSFESKYRYRDSKRKCPSCGSESLISNNYANGPHEAWYCFPKKGGCGGKFPEDMPEIIDQKTGQIENPDVFDQINTIDKMAQKRSMLAPVLVVSGLSGEFTQDMEDQRPAPEPPKDQKKNPEPKPIAKSKPKAVKKTEATPSAGGEYANVPLRVKLRDIFEAVKAVSGKDDGYCFHKITDTTLTLDEMHLMTADQLNDSIKRGEKILSQLKGAA